MGYTPNSYLRVRHIGFRINGNPNPRATMTYTHWFIRARLKTRQLLLLIAIAEEGNIHRAAEVLSMTQPAASKLLRLSATNSLQTSCEAGYFGISATVRDFSFSVFVPTA